MRVIGGIHKGRRVLFPNSKLVRPTTDRVKETLFNLISNRFDIAIADVCDIYAGSGSLGIEALSRGAKSVLFVEKNFAVAKTLIKNVESVDSEKSCTIKIIDSVKFSKIRDTFKFDFILADPPFFQFEIYDVVKNLIENNFLNENGTIFIERSIQTYQKDKSGFNCEPSKRIGDTNLFII